MGWAQNNTVNYPYYYTTSEGTLGAIPSADVKIFTTRVSALEADLERLKNIIGAKDEQSESQQKSTKDNLTLKPCPFCGGQPKLVTGNDKKQCCMSRFRIVCKECGAGTRWYVNTDEAWVSWDGRVTE